MRSFESVTRFDLAFSSFCLQHRFSQQVATVSKAVSHSGDGHLYLMLGLTAFFFGGMKGELFFWSVLMAFSIELPIYWLLKNSVKRRRPEELTPYIAAFITPSDRYSLPSGHTAAGFLFASLIGAFYPTLLPFAFIWACLIGASRVLLGVHFLTDIVVGALLGFASARIVLTFIGM
ncbi:phosphatase PAP2 family protein [Vibrio sp. ZSDE26]|uniref:undecaprenyl-diphosphate phosphatase n=1 Tax=Vibrio amylolyticus TaxID=2847292 RepID=A0A9X1XM09_9VIBR|nr:phosphatase PAP2 family protein [Vibrio amylolyticus]MCK6264735.1 phosphatase PAP2 family protein [Vibrio amylolyticus]